MCVVAGKSVQSWLRYERKMLCTLFIEMKAEIRLIVIGRGGAGSHAHDDQPQKLNRLVTFFEVTPKITFAYVRRMKARIQLLVFEFRRIVPKTINRWQAQYCMLNRILLIKPSLVLGN